MAYFFAFHTPFFKTQPKHFYTFFTHFFLGKPRSDKNRNAPRQLKSSIFISLLKKLVPSLDGGYESEIGVGRDGVILL